MQILILLAVLPAAVLLFVIYKEDKIEKESPKLLARLLLCGAGAAVSSIFAEKFLGFLIERIFPEDSIAYIIMYAFVEVAAVEEGFKLLFCKAATWKNPEFNYRFDGVVYVVFTSLGFAALENIMYAYSYGYGVLLTRALFSIPAHLGFAVFMGSYYGTAKIYSAYGDEKKATRLILRGYIIAVLLHGFYDACLSLGSGPIIIVFIAFVVVMDILVIRRVRTDSKNDRLIHY